MLCVMHLGERVERRFTIKSLAGSGGMGEVYYAMDEETGRPVAIKVLQGASPTERARFENEARALADVCHPMIVRYIAHGYTDSGQPYLAMEWLRGEDLSARLARSRCTVAEALEIVRHAAEGLAVLHARGVVHRDLKPSNLFLVDSRIDQLKLIDFGLARGSKQRVTVTGALVGTPGYIAPEQAQGAIDVGPAADVFSLGCVLFEALSGRPAFHGDNVMAVLVKLILDEPPDLGSDGSVVSPELAALLRRMLAKRPEDRPRDASELLLALAVIRPGTVAGPSVAAERASARLTTLERRVLSVILIPTFAASVETMDGGSLVQIAPTTSLLTRLKATAESVGGALRCLADGSMVFTIGGMGAAKDRATAAARFALSLRALSGDRPIVLATGSAEGGTIGETIERASSRLARLHPAPGTCPPIAIDDVTAALLVDRFDCLDTPSGLELRGECGHHDAARVLLGRHVPCVGREHDLQNLSLTFHATVDESQPHVVLVVAPAGIGKSRLAYEFVRNLRGGANVDIWCAQGDPFRMKSSLALLGDAVRNAIGILGGEPLHERHARLDAAIHTLVSDAEHLNIRDFLGELIGAPFPDDHSPQLRAARLDAAHMADQLQQAFDAFLAARCRRAPVVLLLEDLHWGDLLSIRILDTALRANDQPFLILALARPELFDRFPALWTERRLQQIRLTPLSRRAAEHLVHVALGPDLSQAVRDRLIERADGNAFYLEELIRATSEDKNDLPETVVAMAQSRLEGLGPEFRRALRAASVFGRTFWARGVHALIGKDDDDQATRDLLSHLVHDEVLTRRRLSRFPGEIELEFRHAFLREGAYAMLTAEDRRLGHQLAAEWLENRPGADPRVLAEHWERGGQDARAVDCYVHAAGDSWDSGDAETAAACAIRGLELGAVGHARGALLSVSAAALARQGRLTESLPMAVEAMALLEADSRQWLRTFQTFVSALVMTEPDRAGNVLHAVAEGPPLQVEKVYALAWISSLLAVAGMVEAAREIFASIHRTLAAAPSDPLLRPIVRAAESVLNNVLDGDPWQHMTTSREAAEGFSEIGLRNYQCIVGMMYGKALMELGDHTLAESVQRGILSIAEDSCDPVALAYAHIYLARTLAAFGSDDQLDEALTLASAGIAANMEASGHGYTIRAECLLRRGDLVAAEAEARTACEVTRPFRAYWWRATAVRTRILLELDRVSEAVAVACEAVDCLLTLGMRGSGDLELLQVAAEAHHLAGEDERALSLLHTTLRRLHDMLARIPAEFRPRFLRCVAPNARILQCARAWLGPSAPMLAGLAYGMDSSVDSA